MNKNLKPDYLDGLINDANSIMGSDKALAAELGVSKTVLSDWRHGRKRCSPEDQILMAEIGGQDTIKASIRAIIERYAGTKKGKQLAEALKQPLAMGFPHTPDASYRVNANRYPVIDHSMFISKGGS